MIYYKNPVIQKCLFCLGTFILPFKNNKYILSVKMTEFQCVKIIELIDKDTGKKQPYVLQLNMLGKGYYGSVFKAVHKDNPNKVFAVKIIKLINQQSKEEILKELEIIQQIPRSPNLVDTHKQHLESEKHLYIFQQYCDGGSLAQFILKNQGRLIRQSEAYDLFYQLAWGLLEINRAGIIHEDIKPSNILIKGRLYKYCDFGVSQLVSQLKHSINRKGTISYMPLQKLLPKFLPSAKSDIYSLGITLYEVIFGFHPYLSKKTKDIKEYVKALKSAQLRPSHQLLIKVYNPSIMFNNFLKIIESMIALKVELRIGIQQLQDILQNRQPFNKMKIPTQDQAPKIIYNPYSCSSKYNVVAQSKIIFAANQDNCENKFVNQELPVDLFQSSQLNPLEQTLRLTKIQEEQSRLFLNLMAEHKLLQAVVNHLTSGFEVLKRTFQDVQTYSLCRDTFFKQFQFLSISCLQQQKVCHILNFLILKLNILLMTNFRKSVQKFKKFNGQVQLTEQIHYLQSQLFKFTVKDNIQKGQIKKTLLHQTKNWTAQRYCCVLARQFQEMFKCMIYTNSIRVNFKQDVLNSLWLLHINHILKSVIRLGGTGSIQQDLSSISQIIQSQQTQRLDRTIKKFNIYKTSRIQELRDQFYRQFDSIQGVCLDMQENSGEWENLTELVQEEQVERGEQESQWLQEIDFNQLETIKKEEMKVTV